MTLEVAWNGRPKMTEFETADLTHVRSQAQWS